MRNMRTLIAESTKGKKAKEMRTHNRFMNDVARTTHVAFQFLIQFADDRI